MIIILFIDHLAAIARLSTTCLNTARRRLAAPGRDIDCATGYALAASIAQSGTPGDLSFLA